MSPSRTSRTRALSRSRSWAYRLLSAVLIPALLLAAAEWLLRATDRVVDTDFLLPVAGQAAETANPRFGWRFFPRALSRAPALLHLPAPKAPGTHRIVVLGGSAAHGTPDAAFGFGRMLEVMLRATCPDQDFEVINAAMTAINSHVVREIANDFAEREPDLFVIYAGNNEVVGPYGPGTAFGQGLESLPAIRMRIALGTTGLGQRLRDLGGRMGRAEALGSWQGMEMFTERRIPADDPRLDKVREHFQANLAAICDGAAAHDTPIVMSTVAVNLLDCAPFGSNHREGLTASDLGRWRTAFDAGRAAEAAGDLEAAVRAYQDALRDDDRYAELHYRLAGCLKRLGRDESTLHAHAALELDSLRFRADAGINAAIRTVAGKRANVKLLDLARAFESAPLRAGTPYFYEHVHFTFEGNYEAARRLLPAVQAQLHLPAPGGARLPPSIDEVAERLGFTQLDRYQMAARIWDTAMRPPFTGQADHRAWQEVLRSQLRTLQTGADVAAAAEAAERALAGAPTDLTLQIQVARRLLDAGRARESVTAWQRVLKRLPAQADLLAGYGMALLRDQRVVDAEVAFRHALASTHSPPDLCRLIAGAYAAAGQWPEARRWYQRGLDAAPKHAGLLNDMGMLYVAQQEWAKACGALQRAVALAPQHPAFRDNYASALLVSGDWRAARPHLERAIEIDPWNANARDRLAIVLARSGAMKEALEQIEEALRLRPGDRVLIGHRNELLQHMQRKRQ